MLPFSLPSVKWDWRIIFPVCLLLLIGSMMIFSTTSSKGLAEFNDPYFFIKRHAVYLLISLIVCAVAVRIPLHWYERFALHGYVIGVALILMTLIPGLSVELGGAKRWLNLGIIQFQPVECLKFWWAVSASVVLANKHRLLRQFSTGVIPVFIIMFMPIMLLMMQPDLGNSLLIMGTAFAMLCVSTLPVHIIGVGLIGAVAVVIGSILKYPYQKLRIQSFLNPWADPLGSNYHIIQSFTAIGSGGVLGFGLGESRLKYFYLPLHYSDFIFSILCEEGGLVLASIVVGAFMVLFFRGVSIAWQYPNYSFQQFLALSLTCYLVFQAVINICVVIGLFPVTGIPLTFISYGGTSLITSFFSLGVLYRLGQQA